MAWLFAAIYFVLLVTLGLLTIRKGHWVMFILGLFLPLFWLIGALMRPRLRVA
jgi:hypothetical protein